MPSGAMYLMVSARTASQLSVCVCLCVCVCVCMYVIKRRFPGIWPVFATGLTLITKFRKKKYGETVVMSLPKKQVSY